MKEAETRRVEMKYVSEEAMNEFLRYLYGLRLDHEKICCDVAFQLFQLAHRYELPELQVIYKVFYSKDKPKEWFNPDVILELYYYVRELERFGKLRDHLLKIMKG